MIGLGEKGKAAQPARFLDSERKMHGITIIAKEPSLPHTPLFAPFLTPSIRCTYGMYVSQPTHIAHYIRYAIKAKAKVGESLEVGVHWIG